MHDDAKKFIQLAEKFENWCRKKSLPFWAYKVRDPKGGVYEQLLENGEPDFLCTRRVRVQARLAYVYAHATQLGWFEGHSLSNHAWEYVLTTGCQGADDISGDGFKGCAHLLEADGSLKDGMRDTYAQAFLILAGAWRYKAFHDDASKQIAIQTLAFLDKNLKADNGGWLEAIPASLPRRQNPHMHLFEALMALYSATGDDTFLKRSGEMFTLFVNVFYDSDLGLLNEFFNQNWSLEKGSGGPLEPGHMLEWVWLLREYERYTGENVDVYANALYEKALELGYNKNLGLICDKVELTGPPQSPTFRMWPQTEYIKASVAQARSGHRTALINVSKAIETFFTYYLDVAKEGGWVDCLDETGKPLDMLMPTSTFYHIICAASEVSKFTKELSTYRDALSN